MQHHTQVGSGPTYIHSDIPHKMWKALLVFCVGVVPKCEAVVHLGLAVLFFLFEFWNPICFLFLNPIFLIFPKNKYL